LTTELTGARILRSVDHVVKKEVAAKVQRIKVLKGEPPALAVVLVGERKDSATYVRSKKKSCTEVGITSLGYDLPHTATQEEVLEVVRKLNADQTVNGILIQLPLPPQINQQAILSAIHPLKDVDGLHSVNSGELFIHGDKAGLIPCTPLGCMRLLREAGIKLDGKNAVVLGRSNLVGKPLALLLLSQHATVTLAHSKTQNLPELCRQAEVLVAAIGKPNFVKGDWVKPGAVVIDVGINPVEDKTKKNGYRVVGDVDYEAAVKIAGAITPVPGGVGLMTVAMLLSNTVKAWELQHLLTLPNE